jgi:hypothetical protein
VKALGSMHMEAMLMHHKVTKPESTPQGRRLAQASAPASATSLAGSVPPTDEYTLVCDQWTSQVP